MQENKLPHALLFSGIDGIGKLLTAKMLAKSLLCFNSQQGNMACGYCNSCKMFDEQNHPDFYYLEPEQANLQNTAMWKLHFEIPQSCLAFSDVYAELSTRKDIYDIYVGNISNDDSKGYTVGWNCFQTELAYDPNLKGGTLQIIPHSCTTSTID